jgi:hypothetical protein
VSDEQSFLRGEEEKEEREEEKAMIVPNYYLSIINTLIFIYKDRRQKSNGWQKRYSCCACQ